MEEYPVSEDRTYLRYITRVWVDGGDDLWRAHFYVAWRYRQDGLLSNILPGFETPSEISGDWDASVVIEEGEVVNPEEIPVLMDTDENLLVSDSEDGEIAMVIDPEEIPPPDVSSRGE